LGPGLPPVRLAWGNITGITSQQDEVVGKLIDPARSRAAPDTSPFC
jgi:hypothetical protein